MEIRDYITVISVCINFCSFVLNLWGKIDEFKRAKSEREGA
jgi:hypothetical protein